MKKLREPSLYRKARRFYTIMFLMTWIFKLGGVIKVRCPSEKMFREMLTACYQQLNYIEDALRFKDDGINTDEVAYLFQCVYEAKKRMDEAETVLEAISAYRNVITYAIEEKLRKYRIYPDRVGFWERFM